MSDKFINKVIVDGVTKVDLTQDTITPQTLLKGVTAHSASGARVTGTADPDISASSSGRAFALSDAADARLQKLSIYGKTIPAEKYRVTVYDSNMEQVGDAAETTSTAYTVTGLTSGSSYYVSVEAYLNGEWYGADNFVGAMIYEPPAETAGLHPTVTCTALNNGTMLSWNAVQEATKYFIAEKVGNDYINIDPEFTGTSYYIPQTNGEDWHQYSLQARVGTKWYPSPAVNGMSYSKPRMNGMYVPYISVTRGGDSMTVSWAASVGELLSILYINAGAAQMILPLDKPLRGVMTSAGGSYTDEYGQEWIADEIDFTHGKIIRRIADDGTVLSVPAETPMTAEQTAAWRLFRTSETSCGIYNSEAAFMDISYLRNTDNGRALAAVQDDLQAQISELADGTQAADEDDDNGGRSEQS